MLYQHHESCGRFSSSKAALELQTDCDDSLYRTAKASDHLLLVMYLHLNAYVWDFCGERLVRV